MADQEKAFETFRKNGIRFIAIPNLVNGCVVIVDEHGRNYGGFYSVENFRKREAMPIGKARVSMQVVD